MQTNEPGVRVAPALGLTGTGGGHKLETANTKTETATAGNSNKQQCPRGATA
jgi:hypothetical protein